MATNYSNSQKYRLDLNRPLTWTEGDENERFPTQWESDRTYLQGQVALFDDSSNNVPLSGAAGGTAYGNLSYFQCTLQNSGGTPGFPPDKLAACLFEDKPSPAASTANMSTSLSSKKS